MSTIAKFLAQPPDNFSTQIASSTLAADGLTCQLDSASGLPTEGVGQFFKKDANGDLVAGSVEFCHWTNVAGNTISFSDTGDRGITGSDSGAQAYVADDYFEVWASTYYTSYGGLIAHDSAGVHLSGATYAAPVFSGTATGTYTLAGTPTITSPTINTPTLTLADATTLTTDGGIKYDRTNEHLLLGDGTNTQKVHTGAWTSFVPAWANVTEGNGTNEGYYTVIGKTVILYAKFTLGSSSSVSGLISLTLPVTAARSGLEPIGEVLYGDYGTDVYLGHMNAQTELLVSNCSSTYLMRTVTSATVPFTWTTSDYVVVRAIYEAA